MSIFKKKQDTAASCAASNTNDGKQKDALDIFDFSGENAITVKDVDLYYGSFQALKKINMEMPKHQITAMIGPSGCGKSTLLKSLNRMNDLVEGCRVEGKITIGGKDIYYKGIDLSALRKNVGMVFQKPNPFPMSVYDNIAYGPRTFGIKKKSTLDEIVERSLKGAAMWDELKDRLNKSALGLSGGQQQRLCIARALLKNPKVIILDDSTSAVDTHTDALIRKAFREYIPTTTKIIIAQRISSVQDADRIIVLESGKINGIGTHEELLKSNKIYAEVYYSQVKGSDENAESAQGGEENGN